MKLMRITGMLALGLGFMLRAGGEENAEPPQTEERDFILYTGANLKVMDGENLYPVVRVTPFSIFVEVEGVVVQEDLKKVDKLWIDLEIKLNENSASIANLETKKTYTPGRLLVADWGNITAGSYAAERGRLDNTEFSSIEETVVLPSSSGYGRDHRGSTGGTERLSRQDDAARQDFDAYEVTLELSTEDRIVDPYLLMVTDFHLPSNPDQVHRKYQVKVLEGIGREPVSVRMIQGGFPEGFEVDDCDVYLYSNGREVPTNLSAKQVALTRDEAFQYLILEYLIGHKGETLPPRPMWVGMPVGTKELIRDGTQNPPIRLSLDVKGRVTDLEVPGEGDGGVPAAVLEAFRAFRFYPALDNGKAVEATYTLRPKELIR